MSMRVSCPCNVMNLAVPNRPPPELFSRRLCGPVLPFRVGQEFCWTSQPSSRRDTRISGVEATRSDQQSSGLLRTCRTCKKPFDSSQNHSLACRYHSAHFGGETKRKFESVYTGGTLDTVGGGEIMQYWHCCGSKDPFDAGCQAAPHATYDD